MFVCYLIFLSVLKMQVLSSGGVGEWNQKFRTSKSEETEGNLEAMEQIPSSWEGSGKPQQIWINASAPFIFFC